MLPSSVSLLNDSNLSCLSIVNYFFQMDKCDLVPAGLSVGSVFVPGCLSVRSVSWSKCQISPAFGERIGQPQPGTKCDYVPGSCFQLASYFEPLSKLVLFIFTQDLHVKLILVYIQCTQCTRSNT